MAHVSPRRMAQGNYISSGQYGRIIHTWIQCIGLKTTMQHITMRQTTACDLYRKTGNLRAGQPLLSHMKLEGKVRYLGIEVDDALEMAEQIDL